MFSSLILSLALKHHGIWKEQKTIIIGDHLFKFVCFLRHFFSLHCKSYTLKWFKTDDFIMMYYGGMANPKCVVCNSFCHAVLTHLKRECFKVVDSEKSKLLFSTKKRINLVCNDYHKCKFSTPKCAANVIKICAFVFIFLSRFDKKKATN